MLLNKRKQQQVNRTTQSIVDYEPYQTSILSQWWYDWRRNPPFHRFTHVPAMQREPRLSLGMDVLKGMATSLPKFWINDGCPIDRPSETKQFVMKQLEKFWVGGAPHMMDCMDWGWAGGETIYEHTDDGLEFSHFQKFRAQDMRPVTMAGRLIGLELQHNAQKRYLGGHQAFWTVHRRDYHPWWGRSKYESAYIPWNELYDEFGAMDMRRVFFYKYAFQGHIIRHPNEMVKDPETGMMRNARTVAKKAIENHRSGAVFTLPSDVDPVSNKYKWDVEAVPAVTGSAEVIEYIKNLRREMTEGLGLSEEVFQAAETGSGFSGRKIPETAVRAIMTQVVYWLIHDADRQIFQPLCRMRGLSTDYEIVPFGLIEEDDAGHGPDPMTADGSQLPDEVAAGAKAAVKKNRDPNQGNQLRLSQQFPWSSPHVGSEMAICK